ncbi:hypothetical protein AB0J80_07375 [Actinoplanes sp. NPDC049548]|uniref:hypothetical protein n=1 Tax=Actinoplanes sp. NPDC049548 TaxID=3155152 RepID=UPI003431A87D
MRRYRTNTLDNHRPRWTAALTGLTAAMAMAVAGCGTGDDGVAAGSTPGASQVPTAGSAPAPASAGVDAAPKTYQAPAKGCDGVDTSALDKVLGAVKSRRESVSKTKVLASAMCSVTYASHVLNVHIDISENGAGEIMYQGLRGAQSKQSPVTDLPGVGSGAYSYTDPLTGPNVAAWDGNLYMNVNLGSLTSSTGAEQATEALPKVVSATLAKMRP